MNFNLIPAPWRYGSVAIVTALVVSAAGYGLHSLVMSRSETNHKAALSAQETALNEQCAADKQITEDASHEYQIKLAARDSELARVKRLRPNTCIAITPRNPTGPSQTPTGGEHDSRDGVYSDTLFDYAGKCEGYRLQLDGLIDFTEKVWESRRTH